MQNFEFRADPVALPAPAAVSLPPSSTPGAPFLPPTDTPTRVVAAVFALLSCAVATSVIVHGTAAVRKERPRAAAAKVHR